MISSLVVELKVSGVLNWIDPGRRTRFVLLVAPAVALLVVAMWVLLWNPKPARFTLSLSAGSELGVRHRLAQRFAIDLKRHQIELKLVPAEGSREALAGVSNGQLDLALVQGGLPVENSDAIRAVAVLPIEPLHLLCKPQPGEQTLGHFELSDLPARLANNPMPTINLSTRESGTNILASEVLSFFGLRVGEDFQPTHRTYAELMSDDAKLDDLPDAVFTVSSLPSPLAHHLIHRHGYRLVDLPIAKAFRIHWSSFDRSNRSLAGSPADARIPAFTYQINPPVPDRELHTLGTRLHLVAGKSVPAEAVERIVDLIYTQGFPTGHSDGLSLSQLAATADFELHEGASDYLQKKTPIITEQAIAMTEQVVAITGAVLGGFLFSWQTIQYSRRRKRDQQFLRCIERVGEIERQAIDYERNDAMNINDLIRLQNELTIIRDDMVGQFQRGDIEGADTLSGFLIHVNDANENLTRMILHERKPRRTEPTPPSNDPPDASVHAT